MNHRISLFIGLFAAVFVLIVSLSVVTAQQNQDCPTLVQNTMEVVQNVCQSTRRDQLCYGNINIEASPATNAADFRFQQQGDIVDIVDIESLRLRTLDINSDEWGVALMRVQASLPDEAPESVSILLFGNVEVSNQGVDLVNLPVVAATGANVRLRPAADGPLLGSVAANGELMANGRLTNAAGEEWIRVQFESAPGGIGWVFAPAVRSTGDITTLRVIESASERPFGPMQAFSFKSGEDDRPCEAAPDSGIMIQTPAGVGEISFLINEVNVQIGSTAFLQAIPGDSLEFNTLEGHLIITHDGVTQIIPPGASSSVPLDSNGNANGAPSRPTPYLKGQISTLEYSLEAGIFEEDFELYDALDEDFLDEFNAFFNEDDSEFFDGDANDAFFADFFDYYFASDFGAEDFSADLVDDLVLFLEEDTLPDAEIGSFLSGMYQALDEDQIDEFITDLETSDVDAALVEEASEVYDEFTEETGDDGGSTDDGSFDDNEDSGEDSFGGDEDFSGDSGEDPFGGDEDFGEDSGDDSLGGDEDPGEGE